MPTFLGGPPPASSRFQYDAQRPSAVYWFVRRVQGGTPPYVCCVSEVEHGRAWTAAAADLLCAALETQYAAPTEKQACPVSSET